MRERTARADGTRGGARTPHVVGATLVRTVRDDPRLAVALVVAVAASVVAGLLPPLVIERVTNLLTQAAAAAGAAGTPASPAVAEALSHLVPLAALYLALVAFEGLSGAAREAAIVAFGQRAMHALRSRMLAKLSRLPASYFSANAAGTIVSRIVGDVGTVEALFASGIVSMVADAGTVVGIVAVVFTRSVGLGILLLIALPALFAFTRFVQRRVLRAQTQARAAAAQSTRQIPETIACLRSVQLLGRQRHMCERYGASVDAGFRATERTNFFDSIYSPVIICSSALVVAVMMALSAQGGAVRDLFGMSVGAAVALISYVRRVFTPLDSIGMEIQSLQEAIAGVRRVEEFLAEPEVEAPAELPAAPAGPAAAPSPAACGAPAVEFDRVTFGYDPAHPVLRDFSLRVMPGEEVTLVGRTGAGKSTAMKLALGLYEPDAGTVRVFGMRASQVPPALRRRLYGHVEQRLRLVPGDVFAQVSLGDPSVSEEEVVRALELVGLADQVAALPQGARTPCTPGLFSQGQVQLLSIARALAKDPPLLLLDEITANLDAATEARVMDALRRASRGRTVVSISHRVHGGDAEGRLVRVG